MTTDRELRTDRLLLRPFRLRDVDDVFAYASDPVWGKYLPVPQPYEYGDAERWVAESVLIDWETTCRWAIEYDDSVVGGIDLNVSPGVGIGEIHYSISSQLWNQGLVTEGCRAVVDWGFRERRLERIWTTVDTENLGSARVLEKLGMRKEGVLRKSTLTHGELRDMVVYRLLREEWSKQRG